jgi:heptosyltransferase-2
MKVLIIQQKMIGDVLATSILFEAIKQNHPHSELHYVINSHTYPVVEGNPYVDQFHFFTPKHENSKRQLYQFAKQLQNENFDVVIDVYSKLSSNVISLLSKAKTKISKNKWYTSFIYTDTFKDLKSSNTKAGLALENRLQLLQPLGIKSHNVLKPKIYLTAEEKSNAMKLLESHAIDLKKPLFMIGVLGSSASKTYPFDYMAKVIDTIVLEHSESQILFNYIPKQQNEAKAIYDLCSVETKKHIYFDVFGKSLRDFMAITNHCSALIGNEGGAVNMAKSLNIPTFAIFSPWIEKELWNLFDDGDKHMSVHLKDYEKQPYLNIKHYKQLKPEASELYLKFNPSYFESDFKAYLKRLN